MVFPRQLFSTVSLFPWFLLAFLHGNSRAIEWKAVSLNVNCGCFIGGRVNIGRVMDLFHSQDYWRSSLKKCDRWMLSSDRLERCVWAQAEDLFRLSVQQIHSPFCLNLTNLPHTGLMYFKALFLSLCLFIQFLFACRIPQWLRKYVKYCSLHKGRISECVW